MPPPWAVLAYFLASVFAGWLLTEVRCWAQRPRVITTIETAQRDRAAIGRSGLQQMVNTGVLSPAEVRVETWGGDLVRVLRDSGLPRAVLSTDAPITDEQARAMAEAWQKARDEWRDPFTYEEVGKQR